MTKDELVNSLQKRDPLLANAVSNMVDYISDRFPAAYPSKEQTEAVNTYLHSVYADGDGTMSERNCEHRRIASQKITINAYKCLTVPNLTDCNVCLTISHTTRSIICQREASA